MKYLLIALALLAPAPLLAQDRAQPARSATVERPRHLVLFTRAGPNWAKLRDHAAEVPKHHAIYQRLAASGEIVAGGAFEGEPLLGMTIFRAGIDEAAARALIKDDVLHNEGVVAFEFRTLGVQMGTLGHPPSKPGNS